MKRVFLKIRGIVQGVGFRPFVYNLAILYNLKGWVNNNSEGVDIDIEGNEDRLNEFISELKYNTPPLAKIENIIIEELELNNYVDFEIRESEKKEKKITLISPDMATCKECIRDISDPLNKRYRYAFTNCTNCGPRFSIIKSIPYDREKTTMKEFTMCGDCKREYIDLTNRRFHAQPNACSDCGPNIWIEDSDGTKIEVDDVIEWTSKKFKDGKIFAIKGLGGFHLVCDGTDSEAIDLLRVRKKRQDKPFAVMMKDMEVVKKYCHVNAIEEQVLTGIRKPIVILKQREDYNLPQCIAPRQKTLGVMLPYTPLHQLLFSSGIEVLIMTSANIYGLPLEFKNDSAVEKLGHVVDYFLQHNRDIYIPVDDSVVRVMDDEVRMIRRARGYAPEPLKRSGIREILACGSNMKNTFSIAKENFLFLSQHNGDLGNLETYEHYKNNITHYKNIFSFYPKYLAYDMHPNYAANEYANSLNLPKIQVQHHHAHVVSCLVENNVSSKVIGIAFDGTGYGTDGKIWGGEFLLCDTRDFKRLGYLDYVKMPGGEKAVEEPWRMAVSYLYSMFKLERDSRDNVNSKLKEMLMELYGNKAIKLLSVLDANINCPETSSMGRFYDAVASLIGIRDNITYEGQAAVEMEAIISDECLDYYSYNIRKDSTYIIEPYKIIEGVIKDKLLSVPKEIISAKFHNTVVRFSKEMCNLIRIDTGINEVALSGGVFQNAYLLKRLIDELKNDEFIVYTNKLVPMNDGGVSVGQVVVANEVLNRNLCNS
ncbi:carbamoyltransferase [Clostridium polyendosporum]|uniref:Carbamoyltransferase n=1 Tax=Clostridium polyendosporum TaxID=69208 RepID=A0A919RX51_9CLOT|nr:carbamoyltransferase HypF [Clostridium polyendosporum]GIM28092.1 carbamoyltransferase [Clostridium polyendosporum]